MRIRFSICIQALALAAMPARAETLSSADREALLERLEGLRETVEQRTESRFRAAISAFQAAAASNEAAMEFYLKCVEKVDFEDLNRKNSDFRDWKRREADRLSSPGAGPALRIQLHWLVLTLRVASEKPDAVALARSAREVIDSIFSDAHRFSGQQQQLNQPVTSSIFARAYAITDVKVERWPLAPAQIGPIYEQVLLPPLRHPDRLEELRDAWLRRIQQETAREEHWKHSDSNAPKKIGTVAALRSPELETFLTEGVPVLQWQMETDLFRTGDESGAALRMLAHLERHISHASSREWADEFRDLLAPAPVNPPPTSEE
jgi:hypothetical protein